MLRDLPFDAIEFVAYEQMKVAYRAIVAGRELNPAETSGIGAAAGVATAVLTTPLDVIKTRLMTQGATRQYAGVLDCARKLVAEEGAGALFKGVGPRMTWIGIGGGIFFPWYAFAASSVCRAVLTRSIPQPRGCQDPASAEGVARADARGGFQAQCLRV